VDPALVSSVVAIEWCYVSVKLNLWLLGLFLVKACLLTSTRRPRSGSNPPASCEPGAQECRSRPNVATVPYGRQHKVALEGETKDGIEGKIIIQERKEES